VEVFTKRSSFLPRDASDAEKDRDEIADQGTEEALGDEASVDAVGI